MNQQRSPETEFAQRLRAELRSIVAARGAEEWTHTAAGTTKVRPALRRLSPRLGLAGAAVAAVAAVALVVSAGSGETTAAFAVEAQSDGMVTVEVHSLEDAKGLEQALDGVGIPASVNYLAAGMACKEPRFQTASWPKGGRVFISIPATGDGPLFFSISHRAVGPGQTLVITVSANAEGQGFRHPGARGVELAQGTVGPCEPVPASPKGDGGGK